MRYVWGESLSKVFVAAAYKKDWVCENTGQSRRSVPNGLSDYADYKKAKYGGDIDAALRVVRNVMNTLYITQIKIQLRELEAQGIKDPILVAAFKESSKNVLPRVAAAWIGKQTGLQVDTNIVETDTTPRKMLTKLGRIFTPATFAGETEKGRFYIGVDDNMLGGSTFADLRSHIIGSGSRYAFSCALSTPDGKNTFLKPSEAVVRDVSSQLSRTLKDWMRDAHGVGIDTLTRTEIGILGNSEGRRELAGYAAQTKSL